MIACFVLLVTAWLMADMSQRTYRKIVVTRLSANFEEATEIRQQVEGQRVADGGCVVRVVAVGVNASDINLSNGKYAAAGTALPMGAGFEAVGRLQAVGAAVDPAAWPVGAAVGVTAFGAFAELLELPDMRSVVRLPSASPAALPLLVCRARRASAALY
jgi:prostaglandin reductase 3